MGKNDSANIDANEHHVTHVFHTNIVRTSQEIRGEPILPKTPIMEDLGAVSHMFFFFMMVLMVVILDRTS